jgi:hypothetical protein
VRSTTPTRNKSRSASQRRGDQSTARVNRAQLRAMEARSVAAPPEAFARPGDFEDSMEVSPSGTAVVSRRRPIARVKVLSRAEEYAYIRADMRRLIITASALLVVMIVLLFILE